MKWVRIPVAYRNRIVIFLFLICGLLAIDTICYALALPVSIVMVKNKSTSLQVGSQSIDLGAVGAITAMQFAPHDPVVHEYQIDGTDTTNNHTLDVDYLHSISTSLYYRFQAWMRDLDGMSRWRGLQIWNNGQIVTQTQWPATGSTVPLPSSSSIRIQVELQRPETPMEIDLVSASGQTISITINRNDRQIAINRTGSTAPTITFFPLDMQPFAAMIVDFLVRIVLWAMIVLVVTVIGETLFALARDLASRRMGLLEKPSPGTDADEDGELIEEEQKGVAWYDRSLFRALHPIAIVALVISFGFVVWIALVQYNAEPHIYDASAYLFAAKMYALGRISVPVPAAIDRFPGPFMVQSAGQWFGQYAPGTALTLAPGVWLGVPWLVEPLLGTLALLGSGLVAARLYDRKVATLAVILGTLSPFYSYLAASYLSHAIALFYLVWGIWGLLRFVQGGRGWNLWLAALLFGMAGLTRDQVAILYVVIVVPGMMLLFWRRQEWVRWIGPGIVFLGIVVIFVGITLAFNLALTGNAYQSPRLLFFAGDRWGFGPGVGFYGQHTLAAGLVNLDELLTILAIDLFGWPFYLSLAFLAIPFLTLRVKAPDWLMLAVVVIVMGAFVGYFYHGIYLGPRYVFETLPFLLILTARGIFTLSDWALKSVQVLRMWLASRSKVFTSVSVPTRSVATIVLVSGLVLCNLLYFLPRQIQLHEDYNGLPNGYHYNLSALYHAPLHNAIVVTGDYTIYQFLLFPLNDPLLRGDVLYAWASNTADYDELRHAFPGRSLYLLNVGIDGAITFLPVPPG
jgi:hypothetical protein